MCIILLSEADQVRKQWSARVLCLDFHLIRWTLAPWCSLLKNGSSTLPWVLLSSFRPAKEVSYSHKMQVEVVLLASVCMGWTIQHRARIQRQFHALFNWYRSQIIRNSLFSLLSAFSWTVPNKRRSITASGARSSVLPKAMVRFSHSSSELVSFVQQRLGNLDYLSLAVVGQGRQPHPSVTGTVCVRVYYRHTSIVVSFVLQSHSIIGRQNRKVAENFGEAGCSKTPRQLHEVTHPDGIQGPLLELKTLRVLPPLSSADSFDKLPLAHPQSLLFMWNIKSMPLAAAGLSDNALSDLNL